MALETKIKFLSSDKSGREIQIKDDTGLQVFGRETGYGSTTKPVADILAYHYVVSRIFDSIDYGLVIDGEDPLLPSIEQIAYGQTVTLRTDMFSSQGERGIEEPSEIFTDGVLSIDQYVEFAGLTDVTIEEGTNFIYGGNFEDAWNGDAIIVNGTIYQLDKNTDPNGNTVLYIVGEFEEDATSFNVLYRSNVKVLLTAMSEHLHDYACKKLQHAVDSPEWNKINVAASFRRSAYGLFKNDVPDYFAANSLVHSSFKLLKKYAL